MAVNFHGESCDMGENGDEKPGPSQSSFCPNLPSCSDLDFESIIKEDSEEGSDEIPD